MVPKQEFWFPVERTPAPFPKKLSWVAAGLFAPVLVPKNELNVPVLFVTPATKPKKELPDDPASDSPAPTPTKVLLLLLPLTLNTRLPLRLNCVVALTRFPDSVPPAVPLPLMLKLLDACALALF